MFSHKHNGKCLCGKIQYQLAGKPVWVGYCHCESCRRATGAAAVTHVGANLCDVTFITGKPKIYESSNGVRRGFCAACGSPLTYDSDRHDSYVQIYIGTFDNPEALTPQAHVHCSEKISWFNVEDTLPRFDGSGDDGSGSWRDG